jgi:hypothetical protein
MSGPPDTLKTSRLTDLARLIPAQGPRLRPHTTPPWNLSSWGERLTLDARVRHGDERKGWSTSLKEKVYSRSPSQVTVFCRGALTNTNRDDDTPIGIAAAVAYTKRIEAYHTERPLGKTVAALDVDLAALDTGISIAMSTLVNLLATHILLLTSNPFAIGAILKPGPHPGQPFSLPFRQTADISLHRNLKSHCLGPTPQIPRRLRARAPH